MESLDPLSPQGRRVYNEIEARDKKLGEPGSIVPGGEWMLANPVELGYLAVNKIIKFDPEVAQDGQW